MELVRPQHTNQTPTTGFQNYRQDCETFALVAKKFITKDRSLESSLRLALMETMKDLEKDVWKQFDEYVNELLFISA